MLDDPIIAKSALKHGVGEHDILHVYRNPIRIWDLGEGFTMMVGANAAAISSKSATSEVTPLWSSSTRCAPERSTYK